LTFSFGTIAMKCMKWLSLVVMALVLAACSGGGGDPGSVAGTGGSSTGGTGTATTTPTTSETAVVSDFVVSLNRATIKNDGADQAVLTVITLDATNNVVPGATVRVSADNGAIYVPNGGATTDQVGRYSGTLTSGADKTDRVIRVTVIVNGVSKSSQIQVQGSKLDVTVTPAVANPGSAVTITAKLTDSNGAPIPNANVDISGVVVTTAVTDGNGNARVPFNAPATPGTYNVNVAGSGVQAASSIVVGSTVPAAVIPAGVTPSFAINPTVLAPNAAGSSANQASLRFLILDSTNTPIPNVRVRFEKFGSGLGYDGAISTGASAVLTNASGIATSAYVSGQESSPTNGVVMRACYKATDFVGSECPEFRTASMTVAGSPVAISISDNDALEKGVGTYTQRFAVSIVDSAGRAVANAPVSYSVDITHFGKGLYEQTPTLVLSASVIGRAFPEPDTTSPAVYGRRVLCPNEDANRSNNLDPSEDVNNNGVLEPAKSDISIAPDAAGVTTTDANGILLLKVTWLQKVATWMVYRVKVTTNVSGSESRAESSFPTYFVVGDDADAAPFKIPPYGVGSCRTDG
jgi:hypothetical protein